jgi:hypothetical protein
MGLPSSCSDLINAIKQNAENMKSRLPLLVKEELRKRADPPKFVEKLNMLLLVAVEVAQRLKKF